MTLSSGMITSLNMKPFTSNTYTYCMGDGVVVVVAQYRAAGVNGSGEREWK